jgi:signal transduction histidine kinase
MNRIGIRHWVLAALGVVLALAAWLVAPQLGLAVAAAVFAAWVTFGAIREARVGAVAVAVAAVAAAGFAVDTSVRVRSIEQAWPTIREGLVEAASGQLNETLGTAVDQARNLAILAADLNLGATDDPFATLTAGLDRRGPESGVVLFNREGRPLSWAGRHRLPVDPVGPDGPDLIARITPFYVLLEARRQTEEHVAVSHVLVAADSAVPDRERTVASRFVRETATALELYAPRLAPAGRDVFDYCYPSCTPEDPDIVPDTLFSVRVVPPSQGAAKLSRQAMGNRWVSILAIGLLLLLGLVAGVVGRWLALLGLAAILILTPAGLNIGLATLFSPATYYLETFGPLSASAGALFVSAALVVLLLVPLLRTGLRPTVAGAGVGIGILAVAPVAMAKLASAITPPVAQIGIGQWLSWELSLTLAGVALGLVAAFLLGRHRVIVLGWAPWAAGGLGLALSIVGLLVWRPQEGWPVWYGALWVPAALLATISQTRFRLLVGVTAVAGTAALLLTWSATTRNRLLLAERDARRLSGGDPVAISMLERFAAEISLSPAPKTAAELYAHWRRSPLSADDYPAILATWGHTGAQLAHLELAEVELTGPLLFALARTARAAAVPASQRIGLAPGIHYVIAVPYADSVVVTAAVAPRSRLIPPVRVARFLRGERRLVAPYGMSLGEPVTDRQGDEQLDWRRDERWTVRGTQVLELPGGARHLHVEVFLGDLVPLLVRGGLVLMVDVAVLLLLWGLGETFRGGLRAPVGLRALIQFRSYRSRLAVALAAFFIIPTLGFAAWSAGRLRADAERSRDLLIQQTLSDAAGTAGQWQLSGLQEATIRDRLRDLGERLGADLLWYENGQLRGASVPVLNELGLLDAYLPPSVHRALTARDEIEVTDDEVIGGQATRVGYRALGGQRDSLAVLAAPRLVDVQDIRQEQVDIAFALLLVTIIGLGGAVGLATVAARSLAEPVESLRAAAVAVGRGERVPPFAMEIPTEFASVVEAFERMAQDVERSQAALEAARRRTATVLGNVATGVIALDADMRVTIANPSAAELLENELEAGEDVRAETGSLWEPVWSWVQEFMVREGELDAKEFAVGDRRIRTQIAALRTDPRGCVVALDDVTESARALRVLAWGELARQIAHEIKNPLTPIRLGVQHLLRARHDGRTDFDSALERTSRQILAEIERLDAIARAFSRFGAPPAEAAPLAVADLVSVAKDAAELYELGGGAHVRVEADGPVEAMVRRDEVKEVLINLIENARDAGASEVTIAVDESAGRVTIIVQDDGRGIPADILPRIFEPQFSTTTSGTGLGLAICKRLVESWGGEIQVESKGGRGTRVQIELG